MVVKSLSPLQKLFFFMPFVVDREVLDAGLVVVWLLQYFCSCNFGCCNCSLSFGKGELFCTFQLLF